jgi:hypothetical protein
VRYLSSPSLREPPLSAVVISGKEVAGFASKMERDRAKELTAVEEVKIFSEFSGGIPGT